VRCWTWWTTPPAGQPAGILIISALESNEHQTVSYERQTGKVSPTTAQPRDYMLANQSLAFDEDTGDEPIEIPGSPRHHQLIELEGLPDMTDTDCPLSTDAPPPGRSGARGQVADTVNVAVQLTEADRAGRSGQRRIGVLMPPLK
jgi:hypothetical protein